MMVTLDCRPALASDCSELSTADMANCLNERGQTLVSQLTKAYNQALKRADNSTSTVDLRKSLISSQKTWWKHRESQCNAQADQYAGGSAYTNVYLECMNDMTSKRINELNSEW